MASRCKGRQLININKNKKGSINMQSFKKHLEEKLKASDDMGTWVKDFQDSDAPQFKGKSQKKRQQMAVAAKLSAERNEEVELDEAAPKLKGDWLKKEREKNREHDAAMGRTPTGRKKPVRQMTSTQRSLAKLRGEEVELDEISKKTLGSYVKKASSDMANNAYALGARDPLKKPGSWNKAFKRKAGIAKATDRLTKEEVEQLDELSPNLLHRYVKKAAGNLAGNAAVAAAQASSSMKKSSPDVKRKMVNRMKGISGASGRMADKANMAEEIKLDEQTQYDLVEAYLLENNIDPDTLTPQQLDEIIGKVLGTAFKVGARTALGAGRLAKKAAKRISTSGRADAAEKKAADMEKKNKDRERIKAAQERLRKAKEAAR
jgi:hypothetical protein